ncbi:11098_t:CDS:2 [Ambispora gerdemannii]|uniref:11098_t:CDS:1 n=1 Tax=Ambispora gerdemannii TaxID=144530 RepID=A0A9N9GV31_9GLOM|nr:11098_t:CDS:2 [Ambispora gerdemannii]
MSHFKILALRCICLFYAKPNPDLTVDWNAQNPVFAKADGLLDLSTLRYATTNLVVKDNQPNTPYTYTKVIPHGQPPPEPRSYVSSVVDSFGRIYIWGGNAEDTYYSNTYYDNTMYIFDTNSSTWTYNMPSYAPDARDDYTATLLPNGKIIYIGGIYTDYGDGVNINEIWIYDTYKTQSPWSLKTAKNYTELVNRYGHSAVLGESPRSVPTSNFGLLVLDTRDYSWNQPYSQNAPDKYSIPKYHTATVYQNYMIVTFGALRASGTYLSSAQILDLSNGNYKWIGDFIVPTSSKKKIIIIVTIVSIIVVALVIGVSAFLINKRRKKKLLVTTNLQTTNIPPPLSYSDLPFSNNNTTNNQTAVVNVPHEQLPEAVSSRESNPLRYNPIANPIIVDNLSGSITQNLPSLIENKKRN